MEGLFVPQYEYQAVEDGSRLTLLRRFTEADDLVEDPDGKGRTYQRILSEVLVGQSSKGQRAPSMATGCGCGNPLGPCSMS